MKMLLIYTVIKLLIYPMLNLWLTFHSSAARQRLFFAISGLMCIISAFIPTYSG